MVYTFWGAVNHKGEDSNPRLHDPLTNFPLDKSIAPVYYFTSALILCGKVVVVKFNFDTSKAIYMQIIDEIKRSIARGQLKPGDKILSQREMAEVTNVNPNTVQRAYQEMERSGLIETLRGQGSFITQNPQLMAEIRSEMTTRALQTFNAEMTALGYTPEEIQTLVKESITPSN